MRARSQSSFAFKSPQKELHEIAIVNINGGFGKEGQGGTGASFRFQEKLNMIMASREEMVTEAFKALKIPAAMWGDAVSNRHLVMIGAASEKGKTWEVSVATCRSTDEMRKHFGSNLLQTQVFTLRVLIMVDFKKNLSEETTLEVEVGAVGDGTFRHFRSVGHKGHVVATPGTEDGFVLSAIMRQNVRHYPYHEEPWKQAAQHYAELHIKESLELDLTPEKKALIHIEPLATRALVPLNTLARQQSAEGLESHFLIKNVLFAGEDTTDGFGVVIPGGIPLKAVLPDGTISSDGLTPGTAKMGISFKLVGVKGAKIKGGIWYPPTAVAVEDEKQRAHDKASGKQGSSNSPCAWASSRTQRREGARRVQSAQKRAAKVADSRGISASEGEISDNDSVVSNMRRRLASVKAADASDATMGAAAADANASADLR